METLWPEVVSFLASWYMFLVLLSSLNRLGDTAKSGMYDGKGGVRVTRAMSSASTFTTASAFTTISIAFKL